MKFEKPSQYHTQSKQEPKNEDQKRAYNAKEKKQNLKNNPSK